MTRPWKSRTLVLAESEISVTSNNEGRKGGGEAQRNKRKCIASDGIVISLAEAASRLNYENVSCQVVALESSIHQVIYLFINMIVVMRRHEFMMLVVCCMQLSPVILIPYQFLGISSEVI